jgi:hypothetical protein
MSPIAENHIIVSNEKALKTYNKIDVTNVVDLKNGKELLSYFIIPSDCEASNDNEYNIKDNSVVISSVVTASARIHMSKFKTDPKLNRKFNKRLISLS